MDKISDISPLPITENTNVLIVEDDDSFFGILDITIRGCRLQSTTIERAKNLSEIDTLIKKGVHRFNMIIFDGNLKYHSKFTETTINKIREIRHDLGFKGIMVAASSCPDVQEKQLESGCDFAISKPEIPNIIKDLNIKTCSKTCEVLEMTA